MLDLLSIAADHCLKSEDSFFLADLGRVVKQFELWKTHLPAVRPFYGSSSLQLEMSGALS